MRTNKLKNYQARIHLAFNALEIPGQLIEVHNSWKKKCSLFELLSVLKSTVLWRCHFRQSQQLWGFKQSWCGGALPWKPGRGTPRGCWYLCRGANPSCPYSLWQERWCGGKQLPAPRASPCLTSQVRAHCKTCSGAVASITASRLSHPWKSVGRSQEGKQVQ